MAAGRAFKDHFSDRAADYARYRPAYPDALFDWLASACGRHERAWDCATGNGQAAVSLASRFRQIIATDASPEQLAAAEPAPNVSYRIAPAHDSGIAPASVDLVTVAQALHWFDIDAFFAECERVLVHGGVLAAWCYRLCRISPECDAVVDHLYTTIVGRYWPPERRLIDGGYRDIAFPGRLLDPPAFEMTADWDADALLGYLRTWSACKRYSAAVGEDPVARIDALLKDAWGDGKRRVHWPLVVRASVPGMGTGA